MKALVARCCGNETAPAELRERLRVKLTELVVDVGARDVLPTDAPGDADHGPGSVR